MSEKMTKFETKKDERGYWVNGLGDKIPPKLVNEAEKRRESYIQKIGNRMIRAASALEVTKRQVEGIVDEYIAKLELPEDWKGNLELTSYDGTFKVVVQQNPVLEFTDQLMTAKARLDALLTKWTDGTRDELKIIVNNAFVARSKGQIDKRAVLALRQLKIDDPEWKAIMDMIGESVQITMRKQYISAKVRDENGKWKNLDLNWSSI